MAYGIKIGIRWWCSLQSDDGSDFKVLSANPEGEGCDVVLFKTETDAKREAMRLTEDQYGNKWSVLQIGSDPEDSADKQEDNAEGEKLSMAEELATEFREETPPKARRKTGKARRKLHGK